MWQAAREERAELDEVVDAYTVFLRFGRACIALLGLLGLVVRSRRLHWLALVLIWQSVLLLLLFNLSHVLFGHSAHRGELRADLIHFIALKRVLFTDLLDLFVPQHASGLCHLVFVFSRARCLVGD